MKKRLIIIGFITVIGLIIINCFVHPKVELWTYEDLPNDYVIEKKSETDMVIGKKESNKIITQKDDKKIGIEEYIAEFSYGENYIALKCLNPNQKENTVEVRFYIIDSQNEDIYGPYDLESTYLEVKEKIVTEELNDWIKSDNIKNES